MPGYYADDNLYALCDATAGCLEASVRRVIDVSALKNLLKSISFAPGTVDINVECVVCMYAAFDRIAYQSAPDAPVIWAGSDSLGRKYIVIHGYSAQISDEVYSALYLLCSSNEIYYGR